jgi:hypothetical protein
VIWLLAHPLPSLVSKPLPTTQGKTEKERKFADGKGGEMGGQGAESYERLFLYKSFNTLRLCLCYVLIWNTSVPYWPLVTGKSR